MDREPLSKEQRQEILEHVAQEMGVTPEEVKRQFLQAVMERAKERERHQNN